jgi:hypothetical protein
MYNLAKAAEAGWKGSVAEARDFLIASNLAFQTRRDSCSNAGGECKKTLAMSP